MRELLGAALEESDQPIVIDMEASIEHMRRGTARYVDTLLVVTEPYFRALQAAGRLVELARELGVPRILAVANKVRSPAEENAIRAFLAGIDVPLAAVVPFDPAVGEADLEGKPLLDHSPGGPAVTAIRRLTSEVMAA